MATPNQSKKSAFPSAIPSVRRQSTSNVSNTKLFPTAHSPLSNPPATPSGIPAFRSLRSLLPFGPNKQSTLVNNASPVTPSSKSTFVNFGSVRKSMGRERKVSLNEESPVISIGRSSSEAGVRRSLSLSTLDKPLPDHPSTEPETRAAKDNDDTVVFSNQPPVLRTPSPLPPIPTDLSIILEADNSGMSKHTPPGDVSPSPSPPPLRDILAPVATEPSAVSQDSHMLTFDRPDAKSSNARSELDADISAAELSTTHVANQVLDAIKTDNSLGTSQWLNTKEAVIIDDDEGHQQDPDKSFNFDALDPDLAALLSPNHLTTKDGKNLSIIPQPSQSSTVDLNQASASSPGIPSTPSAPRSPSSPPAHSLTQNHTFTQKTTLRPRHSRQQSGMPRLRPASVHASGLTEDGKDSDVLPTNPPVDNLRNGHSQRHGTTPSSPLSRSVSASNVPSFRSTPATKADEAVTSTPSLLARRAGTLQSRLGTPSSTSSRLASFAGKRPLRSVAPTTNSFTAPENGERVATGLQPPLSPTARLSPTCPSPSLKAGGVSPRGSMDSTVRGSFDQRPIRISLESSTPTENGESSSPAGPPPPELRFVYGTPVRPSLDELRSSPGDTPSSWGESIALSRTRKRSMSVQERFVRSLGSHVRAGADTLEPPHPLRGEFGELDQLRPSSSLSGKVGRRLDGPGAGPNGRTPLTDWLGPRTVKAFKAAGLIDHDRDGERSAGGSTSALGRFGSTRGSFDYNSRALSRMAMSEVGSGSSGGTGRRGSGTFSAYGVMESPTYTVSSGSRDTPRSTSTAPTSVSSSSYAYLGRERDRDRDDVRELKEKHATETGALLNALSDSQRVTRTLRDENSELRERLMQVEEENETLRGVVGELRKEVGDLRTQLLKTGSRLGPRSTLAPSAGLSRLKHDISSSLSVTERMSEGWSLPGYVNPGRERERFSNALHGRRAEDERTEMQEDITYHPDNGHPLPAPAYSSETHIRRFSTTSSIFPVPPANMTMLLHEQDESMLNAGLNQSRLSLPQTPSVSIKSKQSVRNDSLTSTSISPTTANFSMMTASPKSLFLKPEHEVHLGDLESLDLSIRHSDGDGWDD